MATTKGGLIRPTGGPAVWDTTVQYAESADCGWRAGRSGGGGGAGPRRLGSGSVRGAPLSGGPRHVVRGSGGRRRGGRDDRQLPARLVALLRQFARFLSAAGCQRSEERRVGTEG